MGLPLFCGLSIKVISNSTDPYPQIMIDHHVGADIRVEIEYLDGEVEVVTEAIFTLKRPDDQIRRISVVRK